MNKTSRGFAALEGLLILIIIAIISGTGYFVWHSKQQTDKALNDAAKSSQSTSQIKSKEDSSDINLIATAIVDKCISMNSSTSASSLKDALLEHYKNEKSSLKLSGNYAKAGASCEASSGGLMGGFTALLKKTNEKWDVVFQGQQSPDCEAVDNKDWPTSVLDSCYDSHSQNERAPK